MRTAYFISLHHKPYQFEWLLNAIYNHDDIFLVHIDLKTLSGLKADRRDVAAKVRTLVADRPNIRMMSPRFTNWGGWSLSKVTLDAIQLLLKADQTWTRFINLSGQCYPNKSMSTIRECISAQHGMQYVQMRPFSELPVDDWHLRRALMIETPLRAFALAKRPSGPSSLSIEHKGAQWVILTRAFCEWQQAAPARKQIERYLRFTYLSDELIFQALVRNGPYRERMTNNYGRSIIWPGPKVLTAADYPYLRDDPGLFARKFDASVDVDILNTLADEHGYRKGPGILQ